MLPATGSTTTAATSRPRSVITRSTAGRSLNGSATVSAARACGPPSEPGPPAAPRGARHEEGRAADAAEGPHGAVDSSGDHPLRALEEFIRVRACGRLFGTADCGGFRVAVRP